MAQGERNLRMDALRVFAAFSVVLLHAAARSWDKHGLDFGAVVFFDAAVRYSVPVFVMLRKSSSGGMCSACCRCWSSGPWPMPRLTAFSSPSSEGRAFPGNRCFASVSWGITTCGIC